ncbi:BamA/TamA family outer membrane protein [Olivibacter sp. SDN3]|nr:BamA/TamA family outer membrane protein [Olivibacter sp. SDN3]
MMRKPSKMLQKGLIMKNKYLIVGYAILTLLLASCSNIKYLKEGEDLYVKGEVTVNNDSLPDRFKEPLTESLEGILRPRPNKKFLGLRPKLYFYNIAGEPKKNKGFKHWLKNKVGEEPVLLQDVNVSYNENLVRNRLENIGFFNAYVETDTTIKSRKATLNYTATTNRVYRINKVTFEADTTTEIGRELKNAQEGSLLRPRGTYNLDRIIAERERIDNVLKDKGYYYFSPDHILVQVDSMVGDHKVDMNVKLKNATPAIAKKPYTINNIFIYPEYSLLQGDYELGTPQDAEEYRGYYFIDPNQTFRKFALARTMFFNKGDLYNRDKQNLTIGQLVGMGTFRFVKNNFVPVDSGKTNKLDAHYYLTPQQKKAVRLELLGKTAAVYNGSEVNVSWSHRNAFKGAELFRLTAYGGYEVQSGGGININSNFYRYGLEASLTWPRVIAPFRWEPTRRFVPHTRTLLGYEFLNRRQAYRLNSLHYAWGYTWQESAKKTHELNVLDIAYVQPVNVTPFYENLADSLPYLQRAIDRQFTFGPNYKFTYTNTMETDRKHTSFFSGGLDLSANTVGLILGSNKRAGNVDSIFSAAFSQFIKTEIEYRHYMKLGLNRQLAARAFFGYGYSYGNSDQLPYVKQFFAGGPNSLRAFRARAIGPGSFNPDRIGNDFFVPDMTGDIRLEFNLEYRAKIVSILDWAAFVDVGNIWLQNADTLRPGGQFTRDFAKELAVGGGLGIRLDLTFLILRTDFAIPLRIPYLPENERWVFNKINFRDPDWRRNNIVFNLAIGYPF